MKCADCQTELQQIEYKNILLKECPRCKGRWFDRGELDKAKNHADEDLRWFDFDPFQQESAAQGDSKKRKMCPKCQAPMSTIEYGGSGVSLERCSQCQGVWLQQWEFKKIIEYLENIIVTETTAGYIKDSFKKFLEIFWGREELTTEVKDFLVVLKLLKMRIAAEHPELEEATGKIFQYLPFL